MFRRALPFLLLLAGAGGLTALAVTRPGPQPVRSSEKVWRVETMPAAPQTLSPTLTLYARVDTPRAATLSAAVSGDVLEVSAQEGREVAHGEPLVRLDDRDALLAQAQREADVAELRAELQNELNRYANDQRALEFELRLLELARRDVERARKLATRDLGSAAGLDDALQAEARQALAVDGRRTAISDHGSRRAVLEARLSRAQAQLELTRLDVARTRIAAPFAARIARVHIAPGDRVRAGDPLLTLFDAAALELRAQVPTRYLSRLREPLDSGSQVTARARVDGHTVHASLSRLGAEVERGRGGADALFTITGAKGSALELGRTVELTVSLPVVGAVVPVPAEALYGTERVYVLEDTRMRALTVQRLGEYHDADDRHWLLVKSPKLAEGTPVIVTQLPNAGDGLKVQLQGD